MISSPGCVCRGAVVPGAELDDRLDDLASRDAEIVPLEIDAPGAHVLRLPPVERQAGGGDQRRNGHDSSRFHAHSFRAFTVIRAASGTRRGVLQRRGAAVPRPRSAHPCRPR